ncbi:hypothetical protein ACIO93_03495 [Streptomyces sp. NPDC087903]|uniref:hypothetical protein n=1 Tax=Streptomyces sp. NPDC087903 TaxID=3365819 RepID=UPI00380873CA
MRSTRMFMATAAASAVLAFTAPGAYAAGDGWDHEDSSSTSSYSKEHDKDSSHESPHGGVHTGGGALTATTTGDDWATARDPKHDPETYRTEAPHKDSGSSEHGKDSSAGGHDKDSWSGGDHEQPRGGMHTGGGGLAAPGVTAGGLAVLAVAGAGVFAMRRNKTAGNVA